MNDSGDLTSAASHTSGDRRSPAVPMLNTPMPKKTKKSAVMRQEEETLKAINKALSKQQSNDKDDSDEAYGKYIASELRSITDNYTKDCVKHEFSRIIFEAKWKSQCSSSNSRTQLIHAHQHPQQQPLPAVPFQQPHCQPSTVDMRVAGCDMSASAAIYSQRQQPAQFNSDQQLCFPSEPEQLFTYQFM